MKFNTSAILRFIGRALGSALKDAAKQQGSNANRGSNRSGSLPSTRRPTASTTSSNAKGSWEFGGYPGDFRGTVNAQYAPQADGRPDPGEVVWAWVPYEEDHAQGKDRPVLLVGRDANYLLALMLTSKDHTNTRTNDRDYLDVGTGAWDKQGRPSEVKLDRVIRLNEGGIRREGAIMDRQNFTRVAESLASA
ncbi:hypothetical protein CGQ24_09950 [Arthrobacter sp. 7749]|nr:hypothetical protein CGQ24_09950 [Arthrobacter sp. 7749]